MVGELTRPAIRPLIDRVRQRRAATGDGRSQHGPDGVVQPPHLGGGETIGPAQWMDASPPQRLVGVNVAQAGQKALIEQQRFDAPAPPR